MSRRIASAWNIPTPEVETTGEVLKYVLIDATWLAHGWTLLIARSQHHVLNWQWATNENTAAYTALLTKLTPPTVVITDGAKGALQAIRQAWPDTRIQRCLIHVHRNNLTDLTRHPKTMAGQSLLELSRQLLKVRTISHALKWQFLFHQCGETFHTYFNERTWAYQDPEQALIRKKKWWYTHERDRRVYYRLKHLFDTRQLFTFLEYNTPATTNAIESVNAMISRLCLHHRGMNEKHMIAAIEWLLYTHTEFPLTAHEIHHAWHHAGRPKRTLIPRKKTPKQRHSEPVEIDNTINLRRTYDDGLVLRKGWAGRYKP